MRKGFSLFEMLMALSIMALLGSFVIPNVKKIQDKSNRMASEINVRSIQSAVENYYIDHDGYPEGNLSGAELLAVLKETDILKNAPVNPYYKREYRSEDQRGKILYVAADSEEYQMTLYEKDGAQIHVQVTNF
jgi:prepilin-type N-terminal cleavage/methylation domain-containing protein